MAIPFTPYTFTDALANDVTAARLNAIGSAIKESQLMPAVRAFHNAAQSITTSTDTALALNSERFDQTNGAASTMHDTVTNNSRLTAQVAGIYMISGSVEWAGDAAAASNRIVKIRHSVGPTFIAENHTRCATTVAIQMSVATLYALAVNEYVELVVWHDKGSALNINATGNYSPEFMMVRVA